MKIIAIIPARSGSKGLKNKNILDLCGKPLIQYTIDAAIESKLFDKIFVSTDSKEYADLAISLGAESLPLRESKLATDNSPTSEFLIDVLKQNLDYDVFVLLQPTSPLRGATEIKNALDLYIEKKADSVVAMTKSEKPPHIINELNSSTLSIHGFLKFDSKTYKRQDYEFFYPNGSIFISNTQNYLKTKDFYSENSYAYIMNKKSSVDIDDFLDFKFCEYLLKEEE